MHALVGETAPAIRLLARSSAASSLPTTGRCCCGESPSGFGAPGGVAARDRQIAQEMAIVPELTAAQNVYLGVEPQLSGFVRSVSSAVAAANCVHGGLRGFRRRHRGGLRTADRQKIEILRAIARDAELIVLDEPSAALGRAEIAHLHETILSLRARGRR